ncbi:MAG TPA: glycosyltransferase [Pyrinomonadaceae bacterium]|nr:glycosyltransferase [Pyrinomonadaceae bacterium]
MTSSGGGGVTAARTGGGAAPAGAEAARELRGRDIICFAQDWTGDPLSKTHLMRALARDNRVLWVNSIGLRAPSASAADLRRSLSKLKAVATPLREVEPNIFVLNPLTVPAYGLPFMKAFNQLALRLQVRRAMRRLGFRRAINYVFLPPAALVAGRLGEELVVYHCVDEYAAFSDIQAAPILEMEEILLRRADIVFASAELLVQSKSRHNPRTHLVRHGVDFNHFSRALDPATPVPADIASLPRPVIGFFGLVADWVDVDLMAGVAKHFRHGSLVVLGKVTTDVSALEALPNVHLLGRKPYGDLPAYCKGFDVALMPFRVNELTLNANPLKVREYLAAGLPVVSTPIPEVEVLGLCRIADGAAETIREVEAALGDPGPSRARSEAVRGESWEARLDEIRRHLAALKSSSQ